MTPKPSRAEEMAIFRHSVVGDLLARDLGPGELQTELRGRAARRWRPPGRKASRTFHWKTLQSWYYAAKDGLDQLTDKSRVRGNALALDEEQRSLLLDMRREHPTAAADMILSEAVRHAAIPADSLSEATLRRLFRANDLGRTSQNRADRRQRRRWQADRPCKLWHADVCHVWVRGPDGKNRKAYVHGILDDHSRYIVALEAREHEEEIDMLSILCSALLRFPAPDALYVDNGACYRGEILALCLDRLGIRLIHASPGDPEARGKMERFWRTFRQRCADHLALDATRHDLAAAILAFLDVDYHRRGHGGLLGNTPMKAFQAGITALPAPRTARDLATALEVHKTVLVHKDCTFQLDGRAFEVNGRHLGGKRIELVVDPFSGAPIRAAYQGVGVIFGACDPIANGSRGRGAPASESPKATAPFDPIAALLAASRKVSDE